jgi:hypothetical protein
MGDLLWDLEGWGWARYFSGRFSGLMVQKEQLNLKYLKSSTNFRFQILNFKS